MQSENIKTLSLISSSDILKKLIKDIFGTYFIEEDKWKFPAGVTIGRTFFADRQKRIQAINHTVTDNVQIIFSAALSGNSTYIPTNISRRLAQFYKEFSGFDYDFLIFFEDDSNECRQRKIGSHLSLLSQITIFCEGKSGICFEDMAMQKRGATFDELHIKMMTWYMYEEKNSYTNVVIQNIIKKIIAEHEKH